MKKQGGKNIPQGKIPIGGVALSLSRIGPRLEVQIATDNPQFLVRAQGPLPFLRYLGWNLKPFLTSFTLEGPCTTTWNL